ncbi:MAG: glycosyltransferase family 39 protein [Alphaproteobacteria bacterium]
MPSFLTGYRPYILLTLLCLALFAPGQSALPPVDRDEARFAQATRQMLQTGDYINIRFQDTPRHKKPAGIYWLQAASVGLFGETNANVIWPYRLPSVLGAIAAVLLTFALGCALFERRVAFLGAAILASSSLLVIEAHLAKTDAVLLATILAAMLALARIYAAAREERESGLSAPLVFWGALGVSALVKGPVGPMVALLTVAALWVTDWRAGRATRLIARLKPLIGIPLAIAIFAPWLIAIMSATGGSFVGDAVKNDLLPKLVSGQESHGFPPGYFLLLLTATMWPGSLFVWHGIVWAWQNRWEWPVKFCVAWALPSWIVFELVPTKLPHYVLPLYPALALLAVRAAFALAEGGIPRFRSWDSRLALGAFAGIALAIGIGLVALPIALDGSFSWAALIPLAVALALPVHVLVQCHRARVVPALAAAIVGAAFIFGPAAQWVLPGVQALGLSCAAARLVEAQAGDAQTAKPAKPVVAATGYHEPSLVFMLGRQTKLIGPEAIATAMRSDPSLLALIGADKEARFRKALAGDAVRLKALGSARGFNYSKGDWVTLTLYRLMPRAAHAGDGAR